MAVATNATCVIRSACADDIGALVDLATQLGYPVEPLVMRERLVRVHETRVGEVFVATDAKAHVVGWTHVVPRLQLAEASFAELIGLVVDQTARNVGVGAKLLATAEDWAREQGFKMLRVRSNVLRERAHKFYLRAGYGERKRQVVLEKTL